MPSRGRPWNLLEAVASIQNNSTGLCDIVVCLDNDDPTAGWLQLPRVMCWHGPRQTFIQWVNSGVKAFMHDYFVFAWGADDVRFTTPGWDELVMQNLKRKDEIVYGPDGIQDQKLATHPFVGCGFPQALGYLVYPKLMHYFADNWVQFLGEQFKSIKYVPELKLEHRHHCAGSGRMDDIYRLASTRYMDADYATFNGEVYGGVNGVNIMRDLKPKLTEWFARQSTMELRH